MLVDYWATLTVSTEVLDERSRQDDKWGRQNHPNGTGYKGSVQMADRAKAITDAHAARGIVTWKDILWEEVAEALAESDTTNLRTELIQVAAVASAWAEAIDRRNSA